MAILHLESSFFTHYTYKFSFNNMYLLSPVKLNICYNLSN